MKNFLESLVEGVGFLLLMGMILFAYTICALM